MLVVLVSDLHLVQQKLGPILQPLRSVSSFEYVIGIDTIYAGGVNATLGVSRVTWMNKPRYSSDCPRTWPKMADTSALQLDSAVRFK